jgi:hypothetical protein
MARSRPGRPRKPGSREPNGRIQREDTGPLILPETLARRREFAAANTTDDELRSADFGTPIALLAAHGVITELQKEAALRAERIYAKWRFMCGAPARHASDHAGGGPSSDPDERAWQHAKSSFDMLERSINRAGILGRTTLESICFDGWYPAIWFEANGRINVGYAKAQNAFRAALDAIVKDFGLEANGTEAQKPLAA